MIVDNLKNCETYFSLHKHFKAIFEAVKTLDETYAGKRVTIEEGNARVNTSRVAQAPEGKRVAEAHKKFIDIHFVLKGKETFGYANIDDIVATTEYDDEKDYFLLEGDMTEITLHEGDFCIVYPQDAHMPIMRKECEDDLIRCVAKIRL